jgi:myo-inositol-1(or 4)-monophosphatase
MSLVADGRFDAMLTLRPTWEWDVAAGALLAAEAGARVSDRSGAPLRFNAATPLVHGVLAAAPAVHAELAGALAPSPAPAP